MASRICPHCQVASHFTFKWSQNVYGEPGDGVESLTAFAWLCDNCNLPVCGVIAEDGEPGQETLWPLTIPRVTYPEVPWNIASAATEAHQALAASAARASVVMARATVEATAKDKGITQGTLEKKIDDLHSNGLISEDMRATAHEIRFAGNEAAHADPLSELISVQDATEIVDLMDVLLQRIYSEPAKVAAVKASRLARRNARATAFDTETS